MKKLITLFFVLSLTLVGHAQWTTQTSGTTNILRCVKFVDLNTGWAVGNKGTIIKTINGGSSWSAQTSNTTTDLYSLSFPTSTTGYVGGDLFRLLKTTNGGTTWSGYGYNWTNKLKSISFGDVNTGVGVGENIIFKTSDGLSNITGWGSFGTQNGLFYISNTGYTVGDGGSIIKLTGVISDFTTQASGTTQNLNGVYFVNTSTGFVVGNNGIILKTVNGGTLWSILNSNVVVNLNSVWFIDVNTGYSVGDNETILKTTDGGTTWTTQLTGGSNKLLSVYFKDANNGWIVGENGEILHTTNGGTAIVGTASTPVGSISRCVGSNIYTTNAVNALSYVWIISPSNSGTIVSSGNSATITWNSNYSGNTTLTSQGVNGSNQGAISNSLVIYGFPSTFSLSAPANGIWTSATPLFQWAASTTASNYNLYIDGILKKANITSNSYQILTSESISSGMHTWYVEASNGCITQSNETWSFRVDATQPTAFSLASPADNTWTAGTQPTLTWGASTDVNSGLAKYQLWIDGVLNRDNISNTATSTTPSSALINGIHTWEIRTVDNVGNIRNSTQIWTVKVDNMPPGLNNSNCTYLQFDGSSNYVVIPNSNSLNITNQKLTIEAWVNIPAYKDWASVATKGLNNSDYALRQHGGKINFSSQDYSGYDGNTVIPLNTWTHIAVTYDGTNISFYFNGIYDGGATISNYIHNYSESLYLGVDFPTIDEYWNGSLDEVRIWNCTRTQTEIISNKDVPLSGFESNLAGYWRFNEGSGSVAFDMTSNHNNGTITGATFKFSPLSASSTLCNLKTPANNQFIPLTTTTFKWGSTQDSGIGFQKFQLFIDGNMVKDNLTDSTCAVTTLSTIPDSTGTIKTLAYGQHTWYVKGFDLLGNNQSSYSSTFYIDNVRPNAFSLTSPTNNQIVSLPTPNLTWQATADSTGGSGLRKYQLLINGVVNRDSIPITQTTVAPKNALAQGVYTWSIKAYDNVGNARQSTQTNTFYVDWENPTDFTLITPLNNSTLTVAKPEFKWHKSTDIGSGISKYELNITGQTPITILPTDTSKTITSNLPNGPYTWYVKAYDVAGSFTSSNTQTFTINANTSGVEQTEINNSIIVYPNPVGNELIIESIDQNERRDFEILNSIGQVVYRGIVLDKTVVRTSGFSSGIYIVKLENGKNYEFKKILKK